LNKRQLFSENEEQIIVTAHAGLGKQTNARYMLVWTKQKA